jgi:hypothetical protein
MADAVSDAGPLIHLDELRQLDLLTNIFKHIYIPEHVIREISNATVHAFIQKKSDIPLPPGLGDRTVECGDQGSAAKPVVRGKGVNCPRNIC